MSRLWLVVFLGLSMMLGGCADTSHEDTRGAENTASTADPCQGIDFAGLCDSTTVTWCEDNQLYTINCKAEGYSGCAWVDGYYDCVDEGETYQECKYRIEQRCEDEWNQACFESGGSKSPCCSPPPSAALSCAMQKDKELNTCIAQALSAECL